MQTVLNEIKRLVCVTPTDFEKLYAQTLSNSDHYLRTMFLKNEETKSVVLRSSDEIKEIIFRQIVATLKIRRGFMLPIGADTETCYQQQDVWTFAIFTAVLVKNLHKSIFANFASVYECVELAKQLLPVCGLSWLQNYPILYEQWSLLLQDEHTTNNSLDVVWQRTQEVLSKEQNSINAENIENNGKDSTIEETKTTNPSDCFVQWIKQSIETNLLSINQENLWLYHVGAGLLVVMPQAWQQFQLQFPDFNKIEVAKILHESLFILNPENQTFFHSYYWGEWEERRTVQGMLINRDSLPSDVTAFPLNEALHPEPQL